MHKVNIFNCHISEVLPLRTFGSVGCVSERSVKDSPLRGSVVSVWLFSLSCWKALLGSNLRRGAPGSFDFSCSTSLFCRLTWNRSLDTSYVVYTRSTKINMGMKYRHLRLRQNICGAWKVDSAALVHHLF